MVDRLILAKHTNNYCDALFSASNAVAERDDPTLLWNSEYATYSDAAMDLDDRAQLVLDYSAVEFVHEHLVLGLTPKRLWPGEPLDNFNFCTIRYALTNTFIHSGDQFPGDNHE